MWRSSLTPPHPRRPTHGAPPVDASAAPDPLDPPPDDSTQSIFPHFKSTRFWLSGQSNFIFQTHPEFHALYSGPHSLGAHYDKATSRLMTLYTGARLNDSTEVLVDIEEAGGAALTTGLGLAGNTDLDIVRNPLLSKAPYLGRGMIHKVFSLSATKSKTSAIPSRFSKNFRAAALRSASANSACPISST